MGKKEDYTISDIYQGGISSFSPNYGEFFTGYRANVEDLGITTNPSNAAVLKEFAEKTNLGVKNIEIEALDPKVFDAMPKQQLKEINRMSQLTGVSVSFHGPLVEPSGLTQQGFSEANREAAERRIQEALERVHDVDPKKMVVNFHTSNMLPMPDITKSKNEKGEEIEKIGSAIIINTDTGELTKMPLKKRTFPGDEKETSVENELKSYNKSKWLENVTHINYYAEMGAGAVNKSGYPKLLSDQREKLGKSLTEEDKQSRLEFNRGASYLEDSYSGLKQLFEKAYQQGSEGTKKKIEQFYNQVAPKAEQILKKPGDILNVQIMKEIVSEGSEVLHKIAVEDPPQIHQDADKFMMKKSSESFGNAAFNSFKKLKDKTPVLVIENPPVGQQFSRGKDVKNMVVGARAQFVDRAVEEGMSRSEAEKQAAKLIGATWDVGHINMLRGKGFTEKDIIKETEEIAPFLKHIHLSDNFGFEHTELPMGMGNVPLKQIMEKLGEKGFEAKKIIEAGDWWTKHGPQGGGLPFTPSLEGMGSPIYKDAVGPYWNQTAGLQQGYSGGFGEMLPQINYETFGTGFSQLPTELGGQRGGAGSRMSGKPME